MSRRIPVSKIFPNATLAFEAVRRELVETAIIAGNEPIGNDDMFTSPIKDSPVTKWSGTPILVVHDGGRFGVAYTSNPCALQHISSYDAMCCADEEAYRREELLNSSDEWLRDAMSQYHDYKEKCSPKHVAHYERLIAEIRLILRTRERQSRLSGAGLAA